MSFLLLKKNEVSAILRNYKVQCPCLHSANVLSVHTGMLTCISGQMSVWAQEGSFWGEDVTFRQNVGKPYNMLKGSSVEKMSKREKFCPRKDIQVIYFFPLNFQLLSRERARVHLRAPSFLQESSEHNSDSFPHEGGSVAQAESQLLHLRCVGFWQFTHLSVPQSPPNGL